MRKNQLQASGIWRNATRSVHQCVARRAETRERAVGVGAELVAVTPFETLIEIGAGSVIVGERSTRWASALTSGQRWAALVFAAESWTRCRRARRLLVSSILAVLLAVTELRLGDALRRSIRSAVGAKELVVGTRDGGAVGLVALVGAVVIAVAVEVGGYAERIGTAKLASMTWREIW